VPAEPADGSPLSVLIGGVGELFQGDLDIGRAAVERLATEDLGDHVLVEDLHYGAVAVAQRLEELRPSHLILVGGVVRGRPAGTVERRRPDLSGMTPAQVQLAVGDAVTGYVSVDLVVEVAAGLGVLPRQTVAIEVEPAVTGMSEHLSPEGRAGLEDALRLVRAEVTRAPLLDLAQSIGTRCREDLDRLGPAPAVRTLLELVDAVEVLCEEGRWGRIHVLRDRLRRQLDAGETGEGMDTLDWALLWALLEELDRAVADTVQ
jgi:hypothetical protein